MTLQRDRVFVDREHPTLPQKAASSMLQLVTVLVLCGCLAVGMALGLLASLKLQAARHPERTGYSLVTPSL